MITKYFSNNMSDTFLQLKNEAELIEFNRQEREEKEHDEAFRRATRGTSQMAKVVYAHEYGGDCECSACEPKG